MSCNALINKLCNGSADPCTLTTAELCAYWGSMSEEDQRLLMVMIIMCGNAAQSFPTDYEFIEIDRSCYQEVAAHAIKYSRSTHQVYAAGVLDSEIVLWVLSSTGLVVSPPVNAVEPCSADLGSSVTTYFSHTGIGAVPSGLFEWSVANTGAANGLLDGVNFPPNAQITFKAYFNPVTNQWVRPNGMSLDASGTEIIMALTE